MKWVSKIDLLANYPRTKRNVKARGAEKTEENRQTARRFGKEFFDGDRRHGYGGFSYHSRFWEPLISTFQKHFGLTAKTVMHVGEWMALFKKVGYTGDYYWFMPW